MDRLESLYNDIMSTPLSEEEQTTYFWNLQRTSHPVDEEWRFPSMALLENKFFQAPNELLALVAMEKYVQSKNGEGFLREVIQEIFLGESYGTSPKGKMAIVNDLFSSLSGNELFRNQLDVDDLRYPNVIPILNTEPLRFDSRWPLCKGMRSTLKNREESSQEKEKYFTLSPIGPWADEDLLGVFIRAKTLPGAIAKLESYSRQSLGKSWIYELLTSAEMNLASCAGRLLKLVREKGILREYPELEIIPLA